MTNPQNPKQKRKLGKGCALFAIAIFVLFIVFLVKSSNNDNLPAPDWNKATYEQKSEWIKKKTNSLDIEWSTAAVLGVKNKFKNPEDVDFDIANRPTFKNAEVLHADSGWVIIRGFGTGKNDFGVKSKFGYEVRAVVRPDTIFLNNARVWGIEK